MSDQVTGRSTRWRPIPLVVVAGLALGLVAVALFAGWVVLEMTLGPYEGRIYPHVMVLGTDLGGLTPVEAKAALAEQANPGEMPTIVLRDGERTWSVSGADLGLRIDLDATVEMAFAVGRADQSWSTLWNLATGGHRVAPLLSIDPEAARDALERLAQEVSIPPLDATLRLENGELIAVPGQPGRALDLEATLARLTAATITPGEGNVVELAFYLVAPRVGDATPSLDQAQALLSRQIQVLSYDVLTDETFSWLVGRTEMVGWLRVERADDGNSLVVRVEPEAIRATLEDLAGSLSDGRGLRLDGAADKVATTLDAGGGVVQLYMTHPERTAVVQADDTLTSIARRYGVPPGLVVEANPGIQPHQLQIGQELRIPSQDLLTPHLPVLGKRIAISLAEQRMRVIENGQVRHEWLVSTGVESSPTYPGTFQILSKEETAYASQWDLWMPNFLAIYRAGGDVYNGIHALPILSNGQRLWAGALGSPASYGCIILGIEEAQTLFDWADVGVVVVIE
jgi:lipoprotein-anchoring transpeptidase ErfK/SrfK